MSNEIWLLLTLIVVGIIIANMFAPGTKAGVKPGVLAIFNGVGCMAATTVNTLLGQPTKSNQFCDALKKG